MSILSKTFTDTVQAEIEINAAPTTVWSILTDLDGYPEWNPFLVAAGGDLTVGNQIEVRIQPVGGRAVTFKPTVTRFEGPREFEWLGQFGLPKLFDGRHRFELVPLDGGARTRFVHSEHFVGLLVPILAKLTGAGTQAGFVAMNDAIKLQAEGLEADSDAAKERSGSRR